MYSSPCACLQSSVCKIFRVKHDGTSSIEKHIQICVQNIVKHSGTNQLSKTIVISSKCCQSYRHPLHK